MSSEGAYSISETDLKRELELYQRGRKVPESENEFLDLLATARAESSIRVVRRAEFPPEEARKYDFAAMDDKSCRAVLALIRPQEMIVGYFIRSVTLSSRTLRLPGAWEAVMVAVKCSRRVVLHKSMRSVEDFVLITSWMPREGTVVVENPAFEIDEETVATLRLQHRSSKLQVLRRTGDGDYERIFPR